MTTNRIAASVAITGLCIGAFALPTMDYLGKGFGSNVKWTMDDGATHKSTFAGEMKLKLTSAEGIAEFIGYCVDATITVSNNTWGVQILNTDSLNPNGARIANAVNTKAFQVNNNAKATALQLVIWELLYETSGNFDITEGVFRATKTDGTQLSSTVINEANTILALQGTSVAPYYLADLNGNTRSSQSFVAPVPEPATLTALGLFGLAAMARRRRRA